MSIGVRVEIADDTPIIQALSQLMLEGGRKAQLFDEIGAELRKGVDNRFIAGVAPDGTPWQQSNRAREQGGQTLIDSAVLRNSMSYGVLSDGVEVGTNKEYAIPLHFGAVIKPVNGEYLSFKIGARWVKVKQVVLPARPILGVSDDDEIEVMKIIEQFLGRAT